MSQRYQGTPQGLLLPPGPWGSPKLPMGHKTQIFWMEGFNSASKILTHQQYNWLFHSSFFSIFSVFSLSSSLLPPRCSFLLVAPSSKSLFPPCYPFLLVAPSSLALLPLRHSFLCFISFRNIISSNLTKALHTDKQMGERTDGRIDGRTDGQTDGRQRALTYLPSGR